MKYAFGLALFVLTLCSSCATILSGKADVLHFKSEPSGAQISIDGMPVCTTPCITLVKRRLSNTYFDIQLAEYKPQHLLLNKRFNTLSIINLAFVLGWGIDAATGAILEYSKKGYHIILQKE